MKIHLIKKETIERYIIANARSRTSFTEFLEKLKYTDWRKPADMKKTEQLQYTVSNY